MIIQASPDTLAAAVASVKAGDTLQLIGHFKAAKPGVFAEGLTLDLSQAVLEACRWGGLKKARVIGGVLRGTARDLDGDGDVDAHDPGLTLTGDSEDLTFEAPRMEGMGLLLGADGQPLPSGGVGLSLIKGHRVRVLKPHVRGLMTGVKADGLAERGAFTDFTVEGGDFADIGGDGVYLANVQGWIVRRCHFHDWRQVGTKHCDSIQTGRPTDRSPACEDGLIDECRSIGRMQSYFVPQSIRTHIRNCLAATDFGNAYGMAQTVDGTIEDCIAATLDGSDTIARVNDSGAVGLRYVGRVVAMSAGRHAQITYSQPASSAATLEEVQRLKQAMADQTAASAAQNQSLLEQLAAANARIEAARAALS